MNADERIRRTTELFAAALRVELSQRDTFLRQECGNDNALLTYLRSLVFEHERYPESTEVPPPSCEVSLPAVPLSAIDPRTIDLIQPHFEVLERRGEGAMGVVYRARNRETGEIQAIKILKPAIASDPAAVERFKNEILLTHRIAHKNVCRTHDLYQFDGVRLIAMEFVEGDSLRGLLQRVGAVSVPQGLKWAAQICDALAEAHDNGVIHRDLKPENIMIDQKGDVKLMDFGIARAIEPDSGTTGTMIGTPGYMCPEQVLGKAVDPRSDVYSLGLVLYEMFTGRQAYQGDTVADLLYKQIHEDPPPPREVNPYIPDYIDRAIRKCLEKNPRARIKSIHELVDTLNKTESPPASEPAPPPWARVAALVTLLTAVLVVGYLFTRPPPPPQHDGRVNAVAFRSDGQVLASGSDDKTIKLWGVPSMRLLGKLGNNDRAILALAFTADGLLLASASQDKTIKVWEVSAGSVFRTVRDELGLSAVALSPDHHWLASTGSQTVRIWDLLTGSKTPVHVLPHRDFVNAVAFSTDGSRLASGSDDEAAWVWDTKNWDLVAGPLRHDDSVEQVAFSPDGKFLASGSDDQTVKIWSTTTWLTVQTIQHQDRIARLAFNSTGNLLMSVTENGTVALWEGPPWKKADNALADQHGTATAWAFNPNGRNLAVGTSKGYVKLQRLSH
jgi:serine/threonine protein kinase